MLYLNWKAAKQVVDLQPALDTTHCLPLDFEESPTSEEGHAGAAVSAEGEETILGLSWDLAGPEATQCRR